MSKVITRVSDVKNIINLNVIGVEYSEDLNQLTYDCEITKINNRKDAKEYLKVVFNNRELFIRLDIFNKYYMEYLNFEQLFDLGDIGRVKHKEG